METLSNIINTLDGWVWGAPLIIILMCTHLYLTIRLKFIQRFIFKGIKLSITPDKESKGNISPLGALSVALAATIGTGNIIGVATAIVMGGPGAVFWCWISGIFGIATKYSESLLAVKYRVMDDHGFVHGGPMYAIERGMKCKWLAVCFSVCLTIACFGIGNLSQSNAVAKVSEEVFGVSPYVTGFLEMVIIGLVVLDGVKVISKVCTALVPAMAVLYVVGCIIVMFACGGYVLPALKLIVTSAFSLKSVTGGLFGAGIMLAMRFGIARGLFSNESGLGSAPIASASAQTRNTVRQALISSTGTFWDTVCVCALTGIAQVAAVMALTKSTAPDFSKFEAQQLAYIAFNNIPHIGPVILAISLIIFAYTTILGWYFYGAQGIHYLGGKKVLKFFRFIFVVVIDLGAISKLDIVWNFSDLMNGLMVIPNVVCLLALSGVLVSETKKYLWDSKDAIDLFDPDCVATDVPKQEEEEDI